jgi:hypothetical protein
MFTIDCERGSTMAITVFAAIVPQESLMSLFDHIFQARKWWLSTSRHSKLNLPVWIPERFSLVLGEVP